MSDFEVNAVNNARVGTVGNNTVLGDLKINQSKTTILQNYEIGKELYGKIRSFHFDLETLQREGIIASREEELVKMQTALGENTRNGAKVAILKGIGGSGKTTLAKLYAQMERSRDPFDNLIWIDAQDATKVEEGFQELLKHYLNVRREVAGKQLADAVYNAILRHKTLVVFDNVEKAEDISDFLPTVPRPPYPQIIITTRNKLDMRGYENHWVPVEVLSLNVSQVYIREKLQISPLKIPDVEEKWQELAVYFGRLVIALRAATMSIVNENERREFWDEDEREVYTVEAYLNEVKQVEILEVNTSNPDDPAEQTYRHLRQIWTKNLDDNLRASSPEGQNAERILQALAFLAPSGVPDRWFRTLLASFMDPANRGSKQTLAQAKRSLVWKSLVESSDGNLVIHRLLQTTLLSRLKAKPIQRTEMIEWLLPAMVELYAILWKEQKLQKFHANLYSLLDNIKSDLCEDVTKTVVAFLVNMNLPGMKACERLLRQLIRDLFEERVSVNRDALNLLVTSTQVVDIVLLLPKWIQEFGDQVPVQEQLKVVKRCFSLKIPTHENGHRFDVYFTSSFYNAVSQVLDKWHPKIEDNLSESDICRTGLDVLSVIEHLCETLTLVLDGTVKIHPYSNQSAGFNLATLCALLEMLGKLKKSLVVAMGVLFCEHMFKTENLEAMFTSVHIAVRWYLTVVEVESRLKTESAETLEPLLKPVSIEELDSVLQLTGVFKFTIKSYQVQLQSCYNHWNSKSAGTLCEYTVLEARVAACFVFILIKTRGLSSIHQIQLQSFKKEAYVPLDLIFLLNSVTKLQWFWDRRSSESVLRAHLLCLGLEPHLELLKANNLKKTRNEEENLQFLNEIHFFIKTFETYMDFCKEEFPRTLNWQVFCQHGAGTLKLKLPRKLKGWFFNWKKCAKIMDEIITRYYECINESKAVIPLSLALREYSSDPKKLVEAVEQFYRRDLSAKEKMELRQFLEEILASANSSDTAKNCECLVSRYQLMLARLEFGDGKTELAIAVALEAFNHQLYCPNSYTKIIKTVQLLLDAYSKFDDAAARSTNVLERLIKEHVGYTDCNVNFSYQLGKQIKTTLMSQSKLVRYLCLVGLTREAADFSEDFLKPPDPAVSTTRSRSVSTMPSAALKRVWKGATVEPTFYDVEGILILAVLLLLKRENDRASKILERLSQKLEADSLMQCSGKRDRRYQTNHEMDFINSQRSCFLGALRKLAAWRLLRSAERLVFECDFLKTGFVLFSSLGHSCWYVKKWYSENVQTEKGRKIWREELGGGTKLLSDNYLVILWIDTMDTLLFDKQNMMVETLFALLERQMELRGTEMKFSWEDSTAEWGIKCLLGMYHRRELCMQKQNSLRETAAT